MLLALYTQMIGDDSKDLLLFIFELQQEGKSFDEKS